MRYFAHIAYNGSNYSGWQIQPNSLTIQEEIESSFQKIFNAKIPITGCGRTDKGVHSSSYYFHFDLDEELPENFIYRINLILPYDIVFYSLSEVNENAHARFDATFRSYKYYISLSKNPFKKNLIWTYPMLKNADKTLMQKTADLIMGYSEFFPFCKTNSDVFTMRCDIKYAKWNFKNDEYTFEIGSDRFLRGMVRLIIGACINVGLGKIELNDVKNSLDKQELLAKSWSVPADGLYLNEIQYPYI